MSDMANQAEARPSDTPRPDAAGGQDPAPTLPLPLGRSASADPAPDAQPTAFITETITGSGGPDDGLLLTNGTTQKPEPAPQPAPAPNPRPFGTEPSERGG
jgi:hypothetical protein